MLNVVSLLWDANAGSHPFSQCYDESWVLRLRDGFARNLTRPHRFVLFTEKQRDLPPEIVQEKLSTDAPSYANCIEPYRLNEPMILVGLDTVIVGNIDHMADYCMYDHHIALPADPNKPHVKCNGVALVPGGLRHIYDNWSGENDMHWMNQQLHKSTDIVFPGEVVSYKCHVKPSPHGIRGARIVYFHGKEKPHELTDLPWVREHWLGEEPRAA